jgi:hypothetical protein
MERLMLRTLEALGLALLLLISASGCDKPAAQATSATANKPSIDKSQYILQEEPAGAVGVMIAREDMHDQDDIVLLGRIGGRANPWIEGRAAFMVIDAAMNVVASGEDSAAGQVCLDDCCAELRADMTTLVKIVDEQGKPLPIDTRELLDVKENDMVVVKGKVHRNDDDGSFTVAARSVYVRR